MTTPNPSTPNPSTPNPSAGKPSTVKLSGGTPRHFLDLADFSGEELRRVLTAGSALKALRRKGEPQTTRPLAGKVLAIVAVQVVQVIVLGALALALGWRPELGGLGWAVIAGALGSVAFTSLGLLIAGTLRAEAVLAVANLLWVLILVGGGLVLPASTFSPGLATVTAWLPAGALGEALRTATTTGGLDVLALAVLAIWAAVLALAASRWFRPTA